MRPTSLDDHPLHLLHLPLDMYLLLPLLLLARRTHLLEHLLHLPEQCPHLQNLLQDLLAVLLLHLVPTHHHHFPHHLFLHDILRRVLHLTYLLVLHHPRLLAQHLQLPQCPLVLHLQHPRAKCLLLLLGPPPLSDLSDDLLLQIDHQLLHLVLFLLHLQLDDQSRHHLLEGPQSQLVCVK